MKVVYKTALKPVDCRAFLKHIICSRTSFPCMHLLLRCAFALAPGDAVVEQAFSRLTRLLAPQRLRIKPKLVEQYLIMALDSIPWTEYNFAPVWDMISTSAQRARFRLARSDRGSKKKKETEKEQRGKKRKHCDVIHIAVSDSDASASSSSCNLVSSSESSSDDDN